MHSEFVFQCSFRLLGVDSEGVDSGFRLSRYGADGLTVSFALGEDIVTAVCPPGDTGYLSRNFVASTPNPRQILIGSAGALYELTWQDQPTLTRHAMYLAADCCSHVGANVLVVVGLTHLVAWGPNGETWTSPELGDDQIRLLECNSDEIVVLGYEADINRDVKSRIDPEKGVLRD